MVYAVAVLYFIVSLGGTAHATTYYVSPTGNDSNDGSSGSPWLKPQKCVTAPVVAGDTCIFKSGTYTDTIGVDGAGGGYIILATSSRGAVNGSSGAPITLRSETPYGAVIRQPTRENSNNAFYISRSYYIVEGFDFDGQSVTYATGASASHAALAIHGNNVIARKNKFHHIARTQCSNSAFGNAGIFLGSGGTSATIERNTFYAIGRLRNGESGCSTTISQHDHGIYTSGPSSVTIQRNVCWDTNRGYCITAFLSGSTVNNLKIYNNTFSGKAPSGLPAGQVNLSNNQVGAELRNNIFHDPPNGYGIVWSPSSTASGVFVTNNMSDSADADMQNPSSKPASGITSSSNLASATLGLANAASNIYTLLSTSAGINQGVNVGLAYNGSNPDIGAYETFVFSVCEVTAGATSTINVTFTNNSFPPLLPATSVTTFTARRNAANNALTGAANRSGDNIITLPVTTAYGGGDAIDVSWASGNLTDSADIGGTFQPLVNTLTNQSCTNSVGGASYTLTQAAYEFRAAAGAEDTPLVLPHGFASTGAAENFATYPVMKGGKHRLRFALTCAVAACPDAGYYLRYSLNGGSYTVVPDAFTADNIAFCGLIPHTPSNGSATTNQLSTAGTFTPGGVVFTSNAIPTITGLASGNKTEVEYCVKYDTDATTHYDFRVYTQAGVALNSYTVTPRVVIQDQASGGLGQ